jgi:phosphomevalonate kinase
VLEGAPALVTAVDRYVIADTELPPDFVAAEVAPALGRRRAPHVDASALRWGDRKLGIGSSAAIAVASLAALALCDEPLLDDASLAERVWRPALIAHRKGQGGGSGVDVVTSAFGGTRRCWLEKGEVRSRPHALPSGVDVYVFAASSACSTSGMLSRVRELAQREPSTYQQRMAALSSAAAQAACASNVTEFVQAVREQAMQLARLGDDAVAPIVPPALRRIAASASGDGVAVIPSGAGGGDVVLCVGESEACDAWTESLERAGLVRVALAIGATGVRRA